MSTMVLGGGRDEEAYEENDDDEEDEGNGIFQGLREAGAPSFSTFLLEYLIVLFVPEVCERDNDQAEERIEAVQGVVDNLESRDNAIDAFGGGPVLLGASRGGRGGGDEGDIDG